MNPARGRVWGNVGAVAVSGMVAVVEGDGWVWLRRKRRAVVGEEGCGGESRGCEGERDGLGEEGERGGDEEIMMGRIRGGVAVAKVVGDAGVVGARRANA